MGINRFCAEHDLDPAANHVDAAVRELVHDDRTGVLRKARLDVHWVEWEDDGEPDTESETIKLKFDELGRLTDYSD